MLLLPFSIVPEYVSFQLMKSNSSFTPLNSASVFLNKFSFPMVPWAHERDKQVQYNTRPRILGAGLAFEALSCPFLMMEFVTFLPLEVKSCRLSHLSASLKWLWHPLGHVSLKLIFFFFFKICQVPLREQADSRPAPQPLTKHSMSNRHPRNFLHRGKGPPTPNASGGQRC